MIPPPRRRESGGEWSAAARSVFSASKSADKAAFRAGPHGILTLRLPRLREFGNVWLGEGGRVTITAEEPDGGLIFTDAEGGLHRLDPAGQVDSGFGDDGTVKLSVSSGGSF